MLDEICLKYNSTKSSKHGNFAYRYEELFKNLESQKIKLLEIGVLNGGSLKSWNEFFKNSELILGLDIKKWSDFYESVIEIGDSTDLTLSKNLYGKYGNFDIIIEDGGTLQENKIKTFENYFPLVKNNGFYCVEHLQHSYESKNGGGLKKQNTIIEYLKNIIDEIHFNGISEKGIPFDRGDYNKILQAGITPNLLESIDYIKFYHGLCIIKKR